MNINWNANGYTENFKFVHKYGEDVLSLLEINENMKVVDLGCGNGALTKKIADLGAKVIGIDASNEMLEVARKSYPELTFIKDDAVSFKLNEQVDAIFSNAVFHWIDDQDKLLDRVYKGLKINGYLVCEFGGKDCAETIHLALENSFKKRGLDYKRNFYFPTIGEYAPILEKHGLRVEYANLFKRKTKLIGENGMKDWIEMFDTHPFKEVDNSLKYEIIDEAINNLRPALYENDTWYADYVRIRLKAKRIE